MGSSMPNMERVDPAEHAEAPPPSHRSPGFGEVELEALGPPPYERPRPFVPKDRPKIRPSPNETPTRPRGIDAVKPMHRLGADMPKERPTQQSLEAVRLAEQESQIARARLKERAPPPPPTTRKNLAAESAEDDDDDDPIAAMRELYAQGEADAALALATSLTAELDEPTDLDPGSLVPRVEAGPSEPAPFSDPRGAAALSPEEEDPFGGLIPVEDELEEIEEIGDLALGEDPFGALVGREPVAVDPPSHSAIRSLPLVAVQTPRLLLDAREIPSLPIDPRAAFLLTLVDGIQSLEEILDICAMPQPEALDLIEKLRTMGVIEM